MPIDVTVAARLRLLDGIPSFAVGFADPEMRARMDAFFRPAPSPALPIVDTHERALPGPHGPVPVRVYTPPGPAPAGAAALVWMHGGAFQAGDLDMPEADWTAREICARTRGVVVSVDYRLAVGGTHYPVPLDDVVVAVAWVRANAADLGLAPDRISVGGASAGATLAAGAALRLRDQDGWTPAVLVLGYPVAHPAVPPASAALARKMGKIPRLLRFLPEDIDGITRNYLGGPPSSATGYAMPALAPLAGLGPVLVLNAEYDDLRPSGEAFTAALAAAGVDVRQVLVREHLHGFLNLGREHPAVDRALDLIADAVARARRVDGPAEGP